MRPDEPSWTARVVATARAHMIRPSWPSGDAAADERLAAGLAEGWTPVTAAGSGERGDFLAFLRERTRHFDAAVTEAITAGARQVVELAAGYDGRSLRFATPGVTFFEVDLPQTQADKRRRLEAVDARTDAIAFVPCDLVDGDLDAALAAAGFATDLPTVVLCEGLLRYLPEAAVRRLLAVTATLGAPGRRFEASIVTREEAPDDAERTREEAVAAIGEAVLTVPSRATALAWLAEAGWTVDSVEDVADLVPGTNPGRLLVAAHR